MSDDINVGQLSEAINNKMDRDMGNQSTGIHHIIETYVSGTSGYRIWDDGYCEQWGRYEPNGSTQTYTTTFAKQFANINYNIQLAVGRSDLSKVIIAYPTNFSSSSVTIKCGTDIATIDWQASGYIN